LESGGWRTLVIIFKESYFLMEWLKYAENLKDAFPLDEFITHIRDEYSTFDWIVEGMFQRTGFKIVDHETLGSAVSVYVIEKSS